MTGGIKQRPLSSSQRIRAGRMIGVEGELQGVNQERQEEVGSVWPGDWCRRDLVTLGQRGEGGRGLKAEVCLPCFLFGSLSRVSYANMALA